MNAEHNHPYILISGGSRNGVSIPILKPNMSVGRDQDADIVIDDSTVSRKHAEIVRAGDDFVLLDLGSKNGSYVNEVKVGRIGQSLKDSDEIRFGTGHMALIFHHNIFSGTEVREPRVTESVTLCAEQLDQEAPADEVLSGPVRVRAVAEGNPQDLNRWVGRLQRKPHIHMLRAVNISANEMEIMLTVLAPFPLARVLSDIGGVASVSSGDGANEGSSEDEPRAFTVVLSG